MVETRFAKMTNQQKTQHRKFGWWMLSAWAFLIIAGIIAKRVFDHAELMVFFHLPAAVCLVMAFYRLSAEFRERYRFQIQRRRAMFEATLRGEAKTPGSP